MQSAEENSEILTPFADVEMGGKKHAADDSYVDAFTTQIDTSSMSKTYRDKAKALQKSYDGMEGSGSKSEHEKRLVSGYDLLDVARPVYNLEYLIGIYEADDTHFAAVQAKTANVVGLGYDFIESPKTMEKEDKIDDDSDRIQSFRANLSRIKRALVDKLDSMNAEDEFIETLEKVMIDLESCGNAYMEIGRTSSGQIGYIGHIPAHTIRIRRRRDGFVQFVNAKPVFFRRFGDRTTKNPFGGDSNPNELIHFKKYTPKDSYYGAPDVIPALSAVAGNHFADQYNLDFFENKAVPRNIIVVRGGSFTEEARNKLIRFFGEDLRGSHHRVLFVPLPPNTADSKHDIEIRNVETGGEDSAFREYTRSNIERILMVHRVPASKLGMSGDNALAAAKDLDKTFREQVCRPTQRVLEKKINRVFAEMTDVFLFKLNELDLTDEVSQANIDASNHAIGAITANEIRARAGRPGLKGGDQTIFEIQERQAKSGAASAQRAEDRSTQVRSRARDTRRATGRTDSVGAARNPKGEGRTYD